MSPPNGEGSAPKLVDHLSRLVESGNELKNALGKFECSLDRQDLFIHFPDSQNNYAGDPSVVVKPNLDALESAEGYVKDFLHKKCRWPLISEFIPPA